MLHGSTESTYFVDEVPWASSIDSTLNDREVWILTF